MKVHVFEYDGHAEVWLDTDVAKQDGLCVGTGTTVNEARDEAIGELAKAMAWLMRMQASDVIPPED